jgi:hypothetical protein
MGALLKWERTPWLRKREARTGRRFVLPVGDRRFLIAGELAGQVINRHRTRC